MNLRRSMIYQQSRFFLFSFFMELLVTGYGEISNEGKERTLGKSSQETQARIETRLLRSVAKISATRFATYNKIFEYFLLFLTLHT